MKTTNAMNDYEHCTENWQYSDFRRSVESPLRTDLLLTEGWTIDECGNASNETNYISNNGIVNIGSTGDSFSLRDSEEKPLNLKVGGDIERAIHILLLN